MQPVKSEKSNLRTVKQKYFFKKILFFQCGFQGGGDPPQEQRHISVFSALTLLTPAHSFTDEEDLEEKNSQGKMYYL